MVKLYNLSGLPDEPLRSLLTQAQRLAGARGAVVVKITRGGDGAAHASRCSFVYEWFLRGRRGHRKADGELKRRPITTRGGYVFISPKLPNQYHWTTQRAGEPAVEHWGPDVLDCAEWFFETAIHEFAHIRDYQSTAPLAWSHHNRAGRRPKHDRRPEEIRAVNQVDDALAHLKKQRQRKARIDDAIIELGLQLEAVSPTR